MATARADLNTREIGARIERGIKVFISHSSKNAREAIALRDELKRATQDVWAYEDDLPFGEKIETVKDHIHRSGFFILLVSDESLESEYVQRELGCALALREKLNGFRPIILHVYSNTASWHATGGIRPTEFPVRDFDTGELVSSYPIGAIRGYDASANPVADRLEYLIKCLKSDLLFLRPPEYDEDEMRALGFFDLYDNLFGEEVKAPESGFAEDLRRDNNEDLLVNLPGAPGTLSHYLRQDLRSFRYQHLSFLPTLVVNGRCVALAFLTYTQRRELIFGSYVGVHESWRTRGTADKFFHDLKDKLSTDFPGCRGMVFEVESFDPARVARIIKYMKESKAKEFRSEDDMKQIENLLRVAWFEWLGAQFFVGRDAEPLAYRQPCLDPTIPKAEWRKSEQSLWLGWLPASTAAMYDQKKAAAPLARCGRLRRNRDDRKVESDV